ncbi:TetR/AcrR family transcriptional regulator [Peribacillus aracenensis]|uniref:TetR/AcrR family transcriptional regulator n=1 Tax=Peribacillus aracenensis TaxID=2976708 RepID=UPI0021A821C5|nr:TetR/AcrR family transcriptional regulator [Peribacillus sp. BBB004]
MTIKTDPRIIRTRKLIMDSFVQLSMKKDFKNITISDITSKATVNRATFYYHFTDKYDLLNKVLKEDLMTKVLKEIEKHEKVNHKTITSIFLSIISFQSSLSSQCKKSFEAFSTTIENVIKKELEKVFYQMLMKETSSENEEVVRAGSVMLSWGIYGASIDWQHNSSMSPEEYINMMMPSLISGVDKLN